MTVAAERESRKCRTCGVVVGYAVRDDVSKPFWRFEAEPNNGYHRCEYRCVDHQQRPDERAV